MKEIVLTIGGREYTMACAAGEETHIAELGSMLHQKLSTLPGGATQNDSRSLLFAALLLADELYELRKSASRQPQLPPPSSPTAVVLPERLDAMADRLEALANALEMPAEI